MSQKKFLSEVNAKAKSQVEIDPLYLKNFTEENHNWLRSKVKESGLKSMVKFVNLLFENLREAEKAERVILRKKNKAKVKGNSK